MNFLHFGLLPYFLPLVAIPIVLHLLTLHRLKTVELSTFRFLFDSYVQQRRRMKFLEALIAFLRTLFLLLLVLSVCRPIVKHWSALFGGSESGRDVVFLIDSSASMNAVTDGISSFDRAKRASLAVVDRLGADDRVTVLRVGAKPEEVCNRFSSDVEAIRNEIQSLDATPSRGNLFAAFSLLFGPEARELSNPIVYLFSDLQASGWAEFTEGESAELLPEDTEMFIVNVGSNQEMPNIAVVGQAPDDQRAIAGLPVKLQPRVTNHSENDTEEVAVSIFMGEKEIARKLLTIKPGATEQAEVVFTPTEAGSVRGRFEIPSDSFHADDTFLFTVTVAPQIPVVLVNGNQAVQPLENEGLYLRTAMVATESDPEESDVERDEALAVERQFVRSLVVEDLHENSVTEEALADADVVILANCGTLNGNHFKWLREFVAGGGGMLIFPGDRVNHDAYTKQFFPSAEIPNHRLVAADLGAPQGDANNFDQFRRFGAIDFAHPIFSVFANSEQPYLTKINTYRAFPITLPEERGNSWPLVEFEDGSPAMLESRYGNGRILLSAFPMNTKWTNLPMKPEFVPLVLRMINHVKRRADVDGPSVVGADSTAEFLVSQEWSPATGTVTDLEGRVTPVSFQRSNSQLVGAFDRTIAKGFYSLEVNGGRAEQAQYGTLDFAVNVAPHESDFTRLTQPQVAKLFPTAKVTAVDASAEAQQLYGDIGDEREIWRPLILLTFAIIGVEFFLSTLGGHLAPGEDQPTTGERIRDLVGGRLVGKMTGAGFREQTEGNAVTNERSDERTQ